MSVVGFETTISAGERPQTHRAHRRYEFLPTWNIRLFVNVVKIFFFVMNLLIVSFSILGYYMRRSFPRLQIHRSRLWPTAVNAHTYVSCSGVDIVVQITVVLCNTFVCNLVLVSPALRIFYKHRSYRLLYSWCQHFCSWGGGCKRISNRPTEWRGTYAIENPANRTEILRNY